MTTYKRIRRTILCICPICLGTGKFAAQKCAACAGTGETERVIVEWVTDTEGKC